MKLKYMLPLFFFLFLCGVASVGAAADVGNTTPDPAQVKQLQERMLGDQGTMALIMAMQSDPEIQALLADPKVLEAVQAGDFGALLKDPRIMKLLDNPQVKEIGKRLDQSAVGGGR